MKVESVKLILDACQAAAHLQLCLPALPEGVTPRSMRVLEQIGERTARGERVRVSDISEMLDVTRPGITAVVRELTRMGYVVKERDEKDARVVYVTLTAAGDALWHRYVLDYHEHLTGVLAEFGDEGARQLADTLARVKHLIEEDQINR